MSRERRVSIASSVVSDVSALPTISEDEIQGLGIEQLECARDELQGLCNTLQSELDLYTRYMNSQIAPEPTTITERPAALSPGSHSGSGTATPTISSLDVRGLWHGQVVTRGRREPKVKLSEREKWQLWQRELEIVMADRRKKERLWHQELHKCQVALLEAEARRTDLIRSHRELNKVTYGEDPSKRSHKIRMTFDQLHRFMEEHVRTRLKQVAQVSVQVALLKGDLAKLRSKLEKREEDFLDLSSEGSATSQVNYLKKRLEHEEVKTRVADNAKVLGTLRQKLDSDRKKLHRLKDEQLHRTTRLEELRSQAIVLEEELSRLSSSSSRITSHVNHQNAATRKRLKAVKECTEPVVTVEEYLKLNSDVKQLEKEVKRWSKKADTLRC